ncbi:Cysteine-rich RLK (RECEPTOR-like protein kinase) 8 [Theobroma cacao]|uniref:Cysteine-rich RLK (RECEPTOR-like protein kinase) 8 n=1 Tax=Theobroma cacao TaxID=3641 RepID=A0A061FA62_THECC|nr:Cysteine-rich RLK (RECEPTOR-like protein kinase) 8 [Theobroma cacao]
MDIHSKDGVLEIPPVTVNDLFIAILVNCVALEHCSNGCPKDLIAYACFMSRLIMFLDGAECLCLDGIIPRFSNDDVQVASFFRYLQSNIPNFGFDIIQDSYLYKTIMEANRYPFGDDGAKKANETLYRSIIGSLLYLAATRPDVMFATSFLSRFMQAPSIHHFTIAKRILRYVKGTASYGLRFLKSESYDLQGFTDSDWARSVDDSKSTGRYCFSFGSGVFTWSSRKQEVVVQSSAEEKGTLIRVDNQFAMAIARNPVQHSRTEHIRVKLHALRDTVRECEIQLEYYHTDDQVADIFTKGLSADRFEFLRDKLGVYPTGIKEVC